MKIWFIEPRPNVFVSGINEFTALRVIDYLYEHCPSSSGMTIFRKIKAPPGYEIRIIGDAKINEFCEIFYFSPHTDVFEAVDPMQLYFLGEACF